MERLNWRNEVWLTFEASTQWQWSECCCIWFGSSKGTSASDTSSIGNISARRSEWGTSWDVVWSCPWSRFEVFAAVCWWFGWRWSWSKATSWSCPRYSYNINTNVIEYLGYFVRIWVRLEENPSIICTISLYNNRISCLRRMTILQVI